VLNSNQARFFLMETHYQNPFSEHEIDPQGMKNAVDSSGLRLYYTANLRTYDAGVLSIGLDPNWRHIIPPEQSSVVSEGHCVEECTQSAFPKTGINIFAATMRTHSIGKKVKLRHIRGAEELAPIVQDSNFDVNHQEYLHLSAPVKAMPGDRMIAECQYDSSSRSAITLGKNSYFDFRN
jgi:Copper type II ascorbate-dependent monooxygenase, C-terminal domain